MALVIDIDKYGVTQEFVERFEYPGLRPLQQDWRWCHKYAHDILTGLVPSCKKMKWAALRHFKDMQRDDIYFDEEAADEIVRWFKFCPIVKGPKSGQPTVLDPSQIFIAASLMAWKWSYDVFEVDDDTGQEIQVRHAHKRRYNQIYAQVSRKYGKTTFTAGIKLYLMRKYKYGPRIFSLATKREQAKEVWSVAKKMIKLSPQLRRFFDPRANEILSPKNEGEFKALASDSNSLDGLDPIAACLDECHAIKDRNLYGVLISAFGSNEGGEYLFSVITTAGFILQGLCTDLYKNGSAVLDPDNEAEQDNYFYVIFEIDQGDDWTDQKSWYKSNPGMVYGRPSLQYMRDRLKEATMSTEEKANFLTKHCNIFVNGSDKWLDINLVRACEIPLEKLDSRIEGYQKEGRKGYAAIDRARVNDICSSTLLYPDDDGGITLKFLNFISQKGYDGAGDYLREVYRKAKESGDLVVLRTNSVRDEDLEEHIIEWFNEYNIEAFHYDPWHMRQICENMEDKGYNMVAVSQGTGNMSEPAKNLEGLFEEGLVRFHSRLFEYACECALMGMTRKNNVEVFRDPKAWKVDKIDPLIATIIALSGATLIKIDKNVYEDRGLFSV
ncbi:terminase [Vibrio phage 1.072.O._10N.286.48.A12]|nr:terminase [Vibrio phage 1.004.O._10N.261.54.A2]AUR83565.1 terminase [Vibrio phage 1.037.O._10N.261.52.F7]AUR84448.1 terminase [Vibrio phage 1.056.O._10N.261.48.C11]AUR84965.1 terminase [Vibrio phage 1.066.O._10N.286.46.E8]AUR85096.1 terminase [Vibrio phage 1.068.O._10N.261.51.F8]AUR85323.1 terminase [Vibrio phage 1.072.O._10N.286.48.A12]